MPEKFTLGPFTFVYGAEHSEVYIIKGEEAAGMVEVVTSEMWADFVEAARAS